VVLSFETDRAAQNGGKGEPQKQLSDGRRCHATPLECNSDSGKTTDVLLGPARPGCPSRPISA
jgi:hypothetical protein